MFVIVQEPFNDTHRDRHVNVIGEENPDRARRIAYRLVLKRPEKDLNECYNLTHIPAVDQVSPDVAKILMTHL